MTGQELIERLDRLDKESAICHAQILEILDEVKALVVPLYQDLNCRVKDLEERAVRQNQDTLEVIRERYGKR